MILPLPLGVVISSPIMGKYTGVVKMANTWHLSCHDSCLAGSTPATCTILLISITYLKLNVESCEYRRG